jgi:hypothetical protein
LARKGKKHPVEKMESGPFVDDLPIYIFYHILPAGEARRT